MKEAELYKQINNEIVQCNLCHHFCILKDGQIGNCNARQNKKGKLYSLVYGYPAVINIDPI